MNPERLLPFLNAVEKLKCNTRHAWTSSGRQESVAEHSWRLSLMALLLKDEFPSLDMEKVLTMCLIHDLGEAVTGDIPAFLKTEEDSAVEDRAVEKLLYPLPQKNTFLALFEEMKERKTDEAKLLKALDMLEALIQHNEGDLSTWLPLEHELNLTYGQEECKVFEYTDILRGLIKNETEKKLAGQAK